MIVTPYSLRIGRGLQFSRFVGEFIIIIDLVIRLVIFLRIENLLRFKQKVGITRLYQLRIFRLNMFLESSVYHGYYNIQIVVLKNTKQ